MFLTEGGIRPGSLESSTFLELSHHAMNVRTYVVNEEGQKEPGVYFLSLDCTSTLASLGARGIFGLPYTLASCTRQSCGEEDAWQRQRFSGSRCSSQGAASAEVAVAVMRSKAQKRDRVSDFLVERYCLYHQLPYTWLGPPSRLLRGRIQHEPWELKPVRLEAINETLLRSSCLDQYGVCPLQGEPTHVHFGNTGSVCFAFFTEVNAGGDAQSLSKTPTSDKYS